MGLGGFLQASFRRYAPLLAVGAFWLILGVCAGSSPALQPPVSSDLLQLHSDDNQWDQAGQKLCEHPLQRTGADQYGECRTPPGGLDVL
jgi:hypothetical protein